MYWSDPIYRSKCLARATVNNAIKAKKIVKGVCEICGTDKKVHAHHNDYAKPLEIRWLCFYHHKEAHGGRFVSSPTLKSAIHTPKPEQP